MSTRFGSGPVAPWTFGAPASGVSAPIIFRPPPSPARSDRNRCSFSFYDLNVPSFSLPPRLFYVIEPFSAPDRPVVRPPNSEAAPPNSFLARPRKSDISLILCSERIFAPSRISSTLLWVTIPLSSPHSGFVLMFLAMSSVALSYGVCEFSHVSEMYAKSARTTAPPRIFFLPTPKRCLLLLKVGFVTFENLNHLIL